jgi:hypothetical protein
MFVDEMEWRGVGLELGPEPEPEPDWRPRGANLMTLDVSIPPLVRFLHILSIAILLLPLN